MAVSNYQLAKDDPPVKKTYKRVVHIHKYQTDNSSQLLQESPSALAPAGEAGGGDASKGGFSLFIYNINGNSNEVSLLPAGFSIEKGTMDDINQESMRKFLNLISNLKNENIKSLPEIYMPIYIINITNVLSNGNKNEVHVAGKKDQGDCSRE